MPAPLPPSAIAMRGPAPADPSPADSGRLLAFHARIRRIVVLRHFTAFTRVLLAVGFIPPGLTKILGNPFTMLGPEHPVGLFFSVFQGAGLWYHFVGWGQVGAAVLLLFPRTATLGAVVYLPIIVNIAMVTTAIDFAGTVVVTWLMTLACLYLLAWDFDRLRAILPRAERPGALPSLRKLLAYPLLGGVGAGGMLLALGALRVSNLAEAGLSEAAVLVGGGVVFGALCALHLRAMPES
jgi:uncharacterized membrane protein YphA (DoxX/SURF4 family)